MAINRTLIEGQRLMREAGKDTRGESLVKGFSTVLAAGIAERKAIKATADKYMEDLGGIENMNLIEPSQRGAVTDFLRTKRDEFNDLATQHAENPSSELRDKMDAIKFQFQTVNNQLKTYMDKRKEYLSDRDEGNLQTNGSFEKDNTFFESTYGNPDSAFSIDYETGKISFTGNNGTDSETRSLDDFGTHTLRNYEAEASTSMIFSNAKKTKWGGGLFDKDGVSQQFVFKHRGQGADEIQSLIQTDLSGDDSDFGFMQQWANGDLIDKSLYDGFEANKDGTYDASWMLENGNKQKVLDAMGKFVGNVSEEIYNNSAENPETVRKRNTEIKRQEKLSNNGLPTGQVPLFKDYEYVGIKDKKLTGPEARKMYDDIMNQNQVMDKEGTTYDWKDDGWYNGDEKVADNNNDLVKHIGILDGRFFNIKSTEPDKPPTISELEELEKPDVSSDQFMRDPNISGDANVSKIMDGMKEYDMPANEYRIERGNTEMQDAVKNWLGDNPAQMYPGFVGVIAEVIGVAMPEAYMTIRDKKAKKSFKFLIDFPDDEKGNELAELEAQRLNDWLVERKIKKKIK